MFVTTAYALSATAAIGSSSARRGEAHTETGVPHGAEEHGAFPPFDPIAFSVPASLAGDHVRRFLFPRHSKMIAPRIARHHRRRARAGSPAIWPKPAA